MIIYANTFYGIPFIQAIFEDEHVFMEEFCTPEEFANDDYCTKAKEMVGTMWTIGTIFSCSGPIIFGTLQQLIGSHWTRFVALNFADYFVIYICQVLRAGSARCKLQLEQTFEKQICYKSNY